MSKKATPKLLTRFIPITRVEEIDDETCRVTGVATSDLVDSYDTVFSYDRSKVAYGQWSDAFERMTGGESKGNIREMHDKRAAGKVVAWTPDDDKREIELSTLIVGKDPVRKCRERIYTGFSHGVKLNKPGRTEKRGGKSITVYDDFDVVEVSLVDSPSNPAAVLTMVRRGQDGTTEVLTPLQAAAQSVLEVQSAARDTAVEIAVEKAFETAGLAASEGAPEPPPAPEVPAAPAPAPETPKPAAEPARAAQPTATATAEPRPLALLFDSAKFTPEQAQDWARAHGFRARRPAVEGSALRIAQIDAAAAQGEPTKVNLAAGVDLLSAPLKADAPVARLLERLRLTKPALERMAQSESSSMLPALSAMASLCYAMDSEIWAIPYDQNDPLAAAQVASLTTACEAILEFIGSELREQLSSLSGGTGEARAAAATAVERFAALPKVLRPAQLERLMQDGDLKKDVAAMHAAGHDLVEATVRMAASCRCERCAPSAPGASTPAPEAQRAAVAPAPAAASAQPPAPAPPASAPATSVERTVEAPPATPASSAQVDAQTTAKLSDLEGRLKAAETRLRELPKTPTRIGRPPAAPVDKHLAGGSANGDSPQSIPQLKTDLERIANAPNISEPARVAIRKQLAELEIMHPSSA